MAYIPPNSNGQATMANSSPVVLASNQSAIPISNLPALTTTTPSADVSASQNRLVGEDMLVAGFSLSGSSVLDAAFIQTPVVGTGVTYNQTSGSLNILTGTSTNAEFLARSVRSMRGAMRLRFGIIASQRIVNNNFMVTLADLLGESLTYNIISTTVVNITLTGHGFTSQNVGQFINIAGITGAAGVPGRYAIAAIVDVNTIQFTVAGWPASGTGTCTLFGRNYVRNLFNGVTATAVAVDSQRNGWAAGDTVAAINTTAGVGTIISNEITGRDVFFQDSLRASATAPTFVTRASRYENIVDQTVDLYVFIWSFNGTTAPASTTTFSLSTLYVESFPNLPVYIQGFRTQGQQNAVPVQLQAGANAIGNITTVTGVTTVSTVNTILNGNVGLPSAITDVASAALTTTTTTAALTPTFGCSYQVTIPVTIVTGTTPTLDVDVQESDDTGTNWFTVYSFNRITNTGIYRSPKLPLRGNRVRYVQTVGGATPSFTRSIVRLQSSDSVNTSISQLIDRNIILTTLSSTTNSLNVQNGKNIQLVINIGVAATPPVLQLQLSDDYGTTWYSIGTPLTAVANSTVQSMVNNINGQLVRAIVTTAGSGVTAGYVLLKAF